MDPLCSTLLARLCSRPPAVRAGAARGAGGGQEGRRGAHWISEGRQRFHTGFRKSEGKKESSISLFVIAPSGVPESP